MSDIQTVEVYRGVGIHDCQPKERIENVVKPEIDKVFALEDETKLFAYIREFRNPPEARLLAGAKLEALFFLAIDERRERPTFNPDEVKAWTAGLTSRAWRNSTHYGTLLHPCGSPASEWETIKRDRESSAAVERDQQALRISKKREAQSHGGYTAFAGSSRRAAQ